VPPILLGPTDYYLKECCTDSGGAAGLLEPGVSFSQFGALENRTNNLSGQPTGEYFITDFITNSGVPNAAVTIQAGTQITFVMWMSRSSTQGTILPRAKVSLNSSAGQLICAADGPSAIQTPVETPAQFIWTCTASVNVTMASSDKFYVWVGIDYTQSGTDANGINGDLFYGSSPNNCAVSIPRLGPGPAVTSVAPTTGAVGTSVTVTGLRFGTIQGTSSVTFNGLAGTPTAWSDTTISVPVPAGAKSGPIAVTVQGLVSNTTSFGVPPVVSSVVPNIGAKDTLVTITGTNFGDTQSGGSITFNGNYAFLANWTDTSITTQVPAGSSSGPVVVVASSPVGALISNGVPFTVGANIVAMTPNSGPVGTSVAISGSLFGNTQGASTVAFNGMASNPSSWRDNTILAPVPVGATTGPIVVTVGGVGINGPTFTVVPGITNLSPLSGSAGTSVTITGSGFGLAQGSSQVTFNSVAAIPTSWGATSIVVPVPAGATSGSVLVTVSGVSSNPVTFGVGPQISSLSSTSGPIGASVSINGTNFGPTVGTSTVTFAGAAATPTSWTPTKIVTTVPSGAASGSVVVTVAGVASNGFSFTVGVGSITGTITQSGNGNPISGALVEALQSNLSLASATTGINGSYTISSLAPGSYDVRISASGFGTAILTGNSVTASGPLTVNGSLASPGTISGKVTQSDGVTALPGATVIALLGIDTAGSATADSLGNYTIQNLSPGTYTLQVSLGGYNSQTLAGVSVSSGITTTQNFALIGQSLITYSYDELGRLVGATDSLGDSVAYAYDAVGNLQSITRGHSNQISIIGFTPKTSGVGSPVTVSGTAFSPTVSLDTVKFNGTTAAITSVTATQIVTSVPAGATTGPISVTAPSGSATSSTVFTVTGALGPPTLSSFTPTIGTAGTLINIVGTNFDLPEHDTATFNSVSAGVSSATSTSISTAVPLSAKSGKISISTPAGNATSTTDFFVPPAPYTASSVAFATRISIGGSFTDTIGTAGQIGILIFDGVANTQRVLGVSGSTCSNCTISLNNPDGTVLETTTFGTAPVGFSPIALPTTGTYTILITSAAVGSMTVLLN
jgi:YD repeat-containing protein